MKTTLKLFLLLNFVLVAGLIYVAAGLKKNNAVSSISLSGQSQTNASSATAARWNDFLSARDRRTSALKSEGTTAIGAGETVTVDSPEANPAVAQANTSSPRVQTDRTSKASGRKTTSGAASNADEAPARPIVSQYPLVDKDVVMNDSTLSPDAQAAVDQVRQKFVDDLGGADQDPTTADYRARWQTAQQDADDALRGILGNEAYQGYQLHHYFTNFQQVMVDAGDGPVTIDPDALAR